MSRQFQKQAKSWLNALENLTTNQKQVNQSRGIANTLKSTNQHTCQSSKTTTGRNNYATAVLARQPPKQFVRNYMETPKFHECISRPRGTHLKSGAVREKPDKIVSFGRLRAFFLVTAFIYCGGQASSLGARMLHEYEIFEIPDDEFD